MYTILSIRRFLLFNLLTTVIATVIFTAIGNYYLDKKTFQTVFDDSLIETALLIKKLAKASCHSNQLPSRRLQSIFNTSKVDRAYFDIGSEASNKALERKESRYEFQLWNGNGQLLLHSHNAPMTPFIGKAGFSNREINGQLWRIFTLYDLKQGTILAVVEPYMTRNLMTRYMVIDDLYLTLLIYPLSGLFIWMIIGSGLKSIRFFANEVANRAAHNLDPVDLNKVPVEIGPLVDELNKLFLRLQQAFEREQRFAADAAHELHTPLAALKTQTQIALLNTTNPQLCSEHLQKVISGVDRCSHVVQQLLTLCRLSPETIMPEHFTHVNLEQISAEVIADLVPQALAKQIDIELIAKEKDYTLEGNTTGLHVLIRNLVDNAIRYTPQQGFVKVILDSQADQLILRVIDNGPGIPPVLAARVFERFFRVLGNTAQGSGLGLTIVEQITKLHQGAIYLNQPKNKKGLEVEVHFPKKRILI